MDLELLISSGFGAAIAAAAAAIYNKRRDSRFDDVDQLRLEVARLREDLKERDDLERINHTELVILRREVAELETKVAVLVGQLKSAGLTPVVEP